MWRIANCVYRAFRNTATHRCSQDVLVPITTVYNTDDDDSKQEEKEKYLIKPKSDIRHIIKNIEFSFKNLEKLQEFIKNISNLQLTQKADVDKPVEVRKTECVVVQDVQPIIPVAKSEETLDSLLNADETCINTIKNLSDLHEETMSIINLQLAIDALESGNLQFGIETLQASTKNGTNAAALYNLGICYERGIGVEQDRAKACDYYRQASSLGHINAQFNLTLLSNNIDINENDDEPTEETIIENSSPLSRHVFFRFSLSNDSKEEQIYNDYQFDLSNRTVACLS